MLLWASVTYAAAICNPKQPLMMDGEILVKFIPGTPGDLQRSINSEHGAVEKDYIPGLDINVLSIPSGKSVDEMIALYQKNKNIKFVEPNYTATSEWVPNDPYYQTQQSGLKRMSPEKHAPC